MRQLEKLAAKALVTWKTGRLSAQDNLLEGVSWQMSKSEAERENPQPEHRGTSVPPEGAMLTNYLYHHEGVIFHRTEVPCIEAQLSELDLWVGEEKAQAQATMEPGRQRFLSAAITFQRRCIARLMRRKEQAERNGEQHRRIRDSLWQSQTNRDGSVPTRPISPLVAPPNTQDVAGSNILTRPNSPPSTHASTRGGTAPRDHHNWVRQTHRTSSQSRKDSRPAFDAGRGWNPPSSPPPPVSTPPPVANTAILYAQGTLPESDTRKVPNPLAKSWSLTAADTKSELQKVDRHSRASRGNAR
ncbi:hypothetical protein C8J57DRAFT_1535597 [Mycena rebaudengoi]|nr:hypothetical protein C8J57DRAFT_1535597 [Mycena rebaudengoi]